MYRIQILFLLLSLMFITSCDRYKHTFEPASTLDLQTAVFSPLTAAFDSITAANLTPVLDFYADDYLHNGQYKDNRENWYQTTLAQNPGATFEVTLMQSEEINDTLAVANWRLKILDTASLVVADSTFLGERLVKRGRGWYLYGNGDDCGNTQVTNQRAIVEYFTFNTCTFCPIVEALLHDLYLSHSSEMTYLEYHLNDPMALPANNSLFQYYGLTNMPATIFQGENIIYGNNEDNPTVFEQLIQNTTAQQAQVGLTNTQYAVVGNTLSGTIGVEIINKSIVQDNLKLKYVIMDKESATYTNAANVPCRNVVLASGQTALAGLNLENPVNFSVNYTGILPDDAYLVIFAQENPADYSHNATIYQGLETHITTAKNKYNK